MVPTPWLHRLRVPDALAWALVALLLAGACSRKAPDGPSSALQPFKRGVQAYQDEDYVRAAKLFEQAAALDDRSPNIYFNLGLSYYQLEAYPEAIEAYSKALKLDPRFADAHMNIALAYDRVYDLEQANAHYNEYLALARAAKPAHGDRGTAGVAATGTPGGGNPSASGAQPAGRSVKPAPGGQALSSLPGGPQARKPGDTGPQPGRSRQASAVNGPPASVNDLRRLPSDNGKPQPPVKSSRNSNPGQPDPWWTQDTPSPTR